MPGTGCNAQGFFINIGDVASAWWTFVITLHTFLILAGGPNVRGWVAEKSVAGKARWVLCFVLWFAVFFLSTVGIFLIQNVDPKNGPFCILLLWNQTNSSRQFLWSWMVLDWSKLLLLQNFLSLRHFPTFTSI
jgi:hypothetical protein